ncbi:glutamyl-tRNA reductase [Arabiibacter massiliensis]|uniref:glutamyl-tRNA reductase n=1 Tax=Arabiibacter massiliensis TaxID=1870985 RepID=UPI0009BB10A5|nr:glutamyl-tRNA reductase [Arabiibacter massiliensis]
MTLIAIGASHKTASADLRGKLSVPADRLPGVLEALCACEAISEAVIVSTCNRTEVYAVALTAPDGVRAVVDELRALPGMDGAAASALGSALYVKQGPGAVEHLLRVVSSLDSLVLGEAQIIGQVRRAFAAAEEAGSAGELLSRLFRCALETGKLVRSETGIGARSVSVSTAAVELAKEMFGTLEGRRVLVIGAGEMGELALGYLHEQGARDVAVANRTVARAEALAARVGGEACGLDELEARLGEADIVIASAAADEPLVTEALLRRARRGCGERPLLVVDVALPRTVEPEVADLPGVAWHDLDGLGDVAQRNARLRAAESVKAEALVAERTDAFLAWLQEREVAPTVKQMHGKARTVCDAEVARAAKALAAQRGEAVSDAERAALEAMASAIAKKLLHGPTARLRKQASDPDGYRYTEAARYLFGLDAYPQGFSCRSDEGRSCRLASGTPCARHGGGACPHNREERSCVA